MKENVFDVLIYLFERFMDSDEDRQPDSDEVRTDLLDAGFPQTEVTKALDWLDALTDHPDIKPASMPAFRVFCEAEMARLDTESRGLLMFLEQCGILTPASRELVIDRVMALDAADMDIEQLKWIVLMVLFNEPGQEAAYAWMEDLVFDNVAGTLH
jgi:Smg protein